MGRTPNEASHIMEAVDLIVNYKDHCEQSTFHVMGIGQTMVILGHTWLMEHNPEIDWHMGDIHLTRCPAMCRSVTKMDSLSELAKSMKGTQELKPIIEYTLKRFWKHTRDHQDRIAARFCKPRPG